MIRYQFLLLGEKRSFIAGAEIASCIAVGCMEGPRVVHRKQIRQPLGICIVIFALIIKRKPCLSILDASPSTLLLFPANILTLYEFAQA